MYLLLALILNFAAWRWSDWRNWQKYYPTILFMIAVNLFYEYIATEYPLWQFIAEHTFLPNVTSILLINSMAIFPPTMLLYLSRYPNTFPKVIRYNAIWMAVYALLEYGAYKADMITYFHGWSLGWSIVFYLFMFPILRLHYKKPVWGWISTVLAAILLWNVFDIPFYPLK